VCEAITVHPGGRSRRTSARSASTCIRPTRPRAGNQDERRRGVRGARSKTPERAAEIIHRGVTGGIGADPRGRCQTPTLFDALASISPTHAHRVLDGIARMRRMAARPVGEPPLRGVQSPGCAEAGLRPRNNCRLRTDRKRQPASSDTFAHAVGPVHRVGALGDSVNAVAPGITHVRACIRGEATSGPAASWPPSKPPPPGAPRGRSLPISVNRRCAAEAPAGDPFLLAAPGGPARRARRGPAARRISPPRHVPVQAPARAQPHLRARGSAAGRAGTSRQRQVRRGLIAECPRAGAILRVPPRLGCGPAPHSPRPRCDSPSSARAQASPSRRFGGLPSRS